MIILFSDFGLDGPYIGQVKAVLHHEAPGEPVIDLFADAPAHNPKLSAYLLAAYSSAFPVGCVFLCVVDPGVGGDRAALVIDIDGRWFVGPDNGLMAIAARRGASVQAWEITWQPAALSASFHGRDLFAPVAARLARGQPPHGRPLGLPGSVGGDWPDDLPAVAYIDRFGNAVTGLRAGTLDQAILLAGTQQLERRRTFSDAALGEAFWYENANGLAEIAVNQGRADAALGLVPGTEIAVMRT